MTSDRDYYIAKVAHLDRPLGEFLAIVKGMFSGNYQPGSALNHAPSLTAATRASIGRSISMRQRNYLQRVIREGSDARRLGNRSKLYD